MEEATKSLMEHPPHPLPNQSVMCFFNSLLQCLVAQLQLPAVKGQLTWQSGPNKMQCPSCAVCESLWRVMTNVSEHAEDNKDNTMYTLFYLAARHPHISPLLLHEYFHVFTNSLVDGVHQDVHELFIHILSLGQGDWGPCERDHSPLDLLHQQFSVQSVHSKQCPVCEATSETGAQLQNIIQIQFENEGEPINLTTYLNGGAFSEAK